MLLYGQINSTLLYIPEVPGSNLSLKTYVTVPHGNCQASPSNWLSSLLATPYPVHWPAITLSSVFTTDSIITSTMK